MVVGTVTTSPSPQGSHHVFSLEAAQALLSPWFSSGNLCTALRKACPGALVFQDTPVQTLTHGRMRQGISGVCPGSVTMPHVATSSFSTTKITVRP